MIYPEIFKFSRKLSLPFAREKFEMNEISSFVLCLFKKKKKKILFSFIFFNNKKKKKRNKIALGAVVVYVEDGWMDGI